MKKNNYNNNAFNKLNKRIYRITSYNDLLLNGKYLMQKISFVEREFINIFNKKFKIPFELKNRVIDNNLTGIHELAPLNPKEWDIDIDDI